MGSALRPIKVWGLAGPNPPKVAMLLKELEIAADIINIPFSDVKNPDYVAINPNGRVPAMHDPNSGLTLWESGAIMEYIGETYDATHKLSFPRGSHEFWLTRQWLFFQTSGQGPYFGQAAWFKKSPVKNPTALDRYIQEVGRVTGVLKTHLIKQREVYPDGDGPWLVGNKFSVADLAFVSWQQVITTILSKEEFNQDDFGVVKEWLAKMSARPAVKEVMDEVHKIHGAEYRP